MTVERSAVVRTLRLVLPAILLLAGTLAVAPVAHTRSTVATTHLAPAASKRVDAGVGCLASGE